MNTEVNAADVISLLSRRIAELTVEVDTYRVAVTQLEDALRQVAMVDALTDNRVASFKNVITTLKNQIVDLGGEPCPCADDMLNDVDLR